MTKIALVLSGGGSKGAYEIGAAIALKKLHKKIDIITGTSIGAINGMLLTQNDLKKAIKLWKHLNFKTIYDEQAFPLLEDEKLSKIYMQYIKGFINEGGLDIYKMKDIFNKYFNPNKFFTSKIDYGLVTFNLSKRKPVIKTKKELTKENTKDYVLASASCYPAFKPYIIENEMYIDGGYHDNLPINLAIDLGAEEIIAVDLRAVGFKKKPKDKTVNITYIKPQNQIGSFLVFDKNQSKKAMKLGYNDTMKIYGKLDGNNFTFKKNNLVRNYNKYIEAYEQKLKSIFNTNQNKIIDKIFQTNLFKEILNGQTTYKNFNTIVELSGKIFGFDESNIYNIKSYNSGLLTQLSNTEDIEIKKIENITDKRKIVKFFYNSIKQNKIPIKFILPFTSEFLVALYIFIIKKPRNQY